MTDTQISKSTPKTAPETDEAFVKPHYLVTTDEDSYTVDVMLPGVTKEQIEASFEDGYLTVTGIRDNSIPEGWNAITREISTTNYRLRLKVNVAIDKDEVSAESKDGVLSMTLPRKAVEKSRKIKVS